MNDKQTVGIITFHCADNFGGVLQAFALQSFIKKNFMVKVEIIDFQPYALTNKYKYNFNFQYVLKKEGFFNLLRRILGRLKNYNYIRGRNKYFDEFRKRHLTLSNETYHSYSELENSTHSYDYYITGSDQVWNFEFDSKTNDAYFLKFTPKDAVKLSYAASTGKRIDHSTKEELINNLNDFKKISIRENSTVEILAAYLDVEASLDPTLLLEKDFYIQKLDLEKSTINQFIFVYDLEYNEELIELANRISRDTGLRIICYSKPKRDFEDVHDYISNKGPLEFLNCIYNAKFVITNSFHGTCFSIIFHKNFYCIPHKTKGARMIDLLKSLELNDRIINKAIQIDNYNNEIDFDKVNQLLEIEKSKSINFLKKAFTKN